MAASIIDWGAAQTRDTYRWPHDDDYKYSRGVLNLVTGSARFPGAATLSALGALHTGLGMLRYLGAEEVRSSVVAAAPETVTTAGRHDAWAIGSGIDVAEAGPVEHARIDQALHDGSVPVVVDAGALDAITPQVLHEIDARKLILTPHTGEFARLAAAFDVHLDIRTAGREAAAQQLAHATGAVVLLKGAATVIAGGAHVLRVTQGTPWHATAGTGDVLTGVIGALLAGAAAHGRTDPDELAAVAASGAWLHGEAGRILGGPFTTVQLAHRLSDAVRGLLAPR